MFFANLFNIAHPGPIFSFIQRTLITRQVYTRACLALYWSFRSLQDQWSFGKRLYQGVNFGKYLVVGLCCCDWCYWCFSNMVLFDCKASEHPLPTTAGYSIYGYCANFMAAHPGCGSQNITSLYRWRPSQHIHSCRCGFVTLDIHWRWVFYHVRWNATFSGTSIHRWLFCKLGCWVPCSFCPGRTRYSWGCAGTCFFKYCSSWNDHNLWRHEPYNLGDRRSYVWYCWDVIKEIHNTNGQKPISHFIWRKKARY